MHDIYKKIVGETKELVKKSSETVDFSGRKLYVAIDGSETLHEWDLKRIEAEARKLLERDRQ